MIRLAKLPMAEDLRAKFSKYKDELDSIIERGEEPPDSLLKRYTEVKEHLLRETHNKCAYCESKFRATSPGHVEHMLPRSSYVTLTLEVSNLTIACEECNRRKGTKPINILINPFTDKPENEMRYLGTAPFPRNGSIRARNTIENCGLDREDLESTRKIVLMKQLYAKYEAYNHAKKILKLLTDSESDNESDILAWKETLSILVKELLVFCAPSEEYSAMCTCALRDLEFEPLTIKRA